MRNENYLLKNSGKISLHKLFDFFLIQIENKCLSIVIGNASFVVYCENKKKNFFVYKCTKVSWISIYFFEIIILYSEYYTEVRVWAKRKGDFPKIILG